MKFSPHFIATSLAILTFCFLPAMTFAQSSEQGSGGQAVSLFSAGEQSLSSFGSYFVQLLGKIKLYRGVNLGMIGGNYGLSWIYGSASADIDFADSKYFGDTLGNMVSDSRAASAYASDLSGNLILFGSNVPRVTNQGLLVEEARTNLVLQSQTFDNAYWLKTVLGTGVLPIITPNAGLAPDGTMTAERIQFNTNGGTTFNDYSRLSSGNITTTAGTQYQISIYLKSNSATAYTLKLQEGNSGNNVFLAVTSKWQRFVFPVTAIGSTINVRLETQGGNTPALPDSADILAWGAQVEAGPFETSYIPTTSTTVTRPADIIQLTGGAATAALSAKSLFAATYGVSISTTTRPDQRIIDFNGTQAIYFPGISTARITNGTNNADTNIGNRDAIANFVKTAASFDSSSMTITSNGTTTVTSANSWGTPSGPVYIGNRAAGDRALNGYLQRLVFSNSKGAFDALTSFGAITIHNLNLYCNTTFNFGDYCHGLVGYPGSSNVGGPYASDGSSFNAGTLIYGTDYTDTLYLNPTTYPNNTTESWYWTNSGNSIYGYSVPADYGYYASTNLPNQITARHVNNITTLKSTHDFTLYGQLQAYDVIYDWFLTTNPDDYASRTFEYEIAMHTPTSLKTYATSRQTHVGTFVDSNGRSWDVWVDHITKSPFWYDILFIPVDGLDVPKGTIDLLAMMNYSKAQGIITGNEYFSGFALGAEQTFGSGTMVMNSFSVVYN